MRIILASKSPRRKELLKEVVEDFEIIVSDIDEVVDNTLSPEKIVESIAYQKAKDIFDKTEGDRIVIGCDTMVFKNSEAIGKPSSEENAKEIIKKLISGDGSHFVVSGLCVIVQKGEDCKMFVNYDSTKVILNQLSDDEIDKWIASGKAMDKAGAYAIQDEFGVHCKGIEGNYSNVIGLPTQKVYEVLKDYIS